MIRCSRFCRMQARLAPLLDTLFTYQNSLLAGGLFRVRHRCFSFTQPVDAQRDLNLLADVVDSTDPPPSFNIARIIPELHESPNNSLKLYRITKLIALLSRRREWIGLMELSAALLPPSPSFCLHSCLLAAMALAISPHPHEAAILIQELTDNNIEVSDVCFDAVFFSFLNSKDDLAILSFLQHLYRNGHYIRPHIFLKALDLCLNTSNFTHAEEIVAMVEATQRLEVICEAYLKLYNYCKHHDCLYLTYKWLETFEKYGIVRHYARASSFLSKNKINDAFQTIVNMSRVNVSIGSDIFKTVLLKVIDQNRRTFGHLKWGPVDQLIWSFIRQDCTNFSFGEMQMLLRDVAVRDLTNRRLVLSSAVEHPASMLEPLDQDVYESCSKRLDDIFYDMIRCGIQPNIVNFKIALGMGPLRPFQRPDLINSRLMSLNASGRLRSLAALWSAVGIATDAKNANISSIILKDNLQYAINDTNALLRAWGHEEILPRTLACDLTGARKYVLSDIGDPVLLTAWTHMLSEFRWNIPRSRPPVPESLFDDTVGALFHSNMNSVILKSHLIDCNRPLSFEGTATCSPVEQAQKIVNTQEPIFIKQSNLNLLLKFCAGKNLNDDFFKICDIAFQRRECYNFKTIKIFENYSAAAGRPLEVYKLGVKMAVSMCTSEDNALGQAALSCYKRGDHSYSIENLTILHKKSLDNGLNYNMMKNSDVLKRTAVHLISTLKRNPKLELNTREDMLDDLAAVLIAQMTNSLHLSYINTMMSACVAGLDRTAVPVRYCDKLIWFGRVILKSDLFDKRKALQILLSFLNEVDYREGILELWKHDDDSFLALYGADLNHLKDILSYYRRMGLDTEYLSLFEICIRKRGDEHAHNVLSSKFFVEGCVKSMMSVIDSIGCRQGETANAKIDIDHELQRFNLLLSRAGSLKITTSYEFVRSGLEPLLSSRSGDNAASNSIINVEIALRLIDQIFSDIAQLPPHSAVMYGHSLKLTRSILAEYCDAPMLKGRSGELTSVYSSNYRSVQECTHTLQFVQHALEELSWRVHPEMEQLYCKMIMYKARCDKLLSKVKADNVTLNDQRRRSIGDVSFEVTSK